MRRQFRWIVMAAALVTICVACSPAMAIGYLSGVLEKAAYVRALTSLLDNAPAWTREILKRNGAYVSSWRVTEDVDGTTYELFNMCVRVAKCIDTSIVLMFAPNGTQAWAGLSEKGVKSYLGGPSEAQQAVLKRQLYVPEPPPATGPYLFDVMKRNPAYARALNGLLDHADKLPSWAQGMGKGNGWAVHSPVTKATIDGTTYELFATCESQNCNLSQLTVMFAPNATQAWGALFEEGTISYLGAPSDAQQRALRETLGDYNGK
jgi:hypothetical protein